MEDQTTPAGDDQPQAAPAVASEGDVPTAPAEGETPAENEEKAAA